MGKKSKKGNAFIEKDYLYLALFGLVGFVGNSIVSDVTKMGETIADIRAQYVQKTDYQADQDRILSAVNDIGKKIDHFSERIEDDYNRRLDKVESRQSKLEDSPK